MDQLYLHKGNALLAILMWAEVLETLSFADPKDYARCKGMYGLT